MKNVKKCKANLTKWDDFVVNQFKKDKDFAKISIESELKKFEKTGDVRFLLITLNQTAKAFGWTNLEKETGISRPALYAALSGKSMPRLDTMLAILKALGYGFSFKQII